MRRRLIIGLVVLVGLLVAADVLGRFVAEAATSRALASTLSLSSHPKVSIGGEPFLTHLLSGSFPSVTIEGRQVDSGSLTLENVHAVLHDVRVPVLSLAGGHRVTVRAASGSGTATLTAAEITRVLQKRGTGVTVEFERGRVRIQLPRVPAFVDASVGVDSGQLVLRSSALGQSITVGLPQVIPVFATPRSA